MNKIALCFLVTKNHNQQQFIKNYIDSGFFDVYVHCDKNVDIGILQKFRMPLKVYTAWGKLMRAQLQLFKHARSFNKNDFFCLLSQSCIPLHKPQIMQQKIYKQNKSIIWYYDHPVIKNGLKYNGIDKNNSLYHHIKKHSQWITLSKHHIDTLLQKNEYEFLIDRVLTDQVYPGTVLSKFPNQVSRRDQTFVLWMANRRPYQFNQSSEKQITLINQIKKNYLFCRKIGKDFNIEFLQNENKK